MGLLVVLKQSSKFHKSHAKKNYIGAFEGYITYLVKVGDVLIVWPYSSILKSYFINFWLLANFAFIFILFGLSYSSSGAHMTEHVSELVKSIFARKKALTGGGVEDTRLKAKAKTKDTKKSEAKAKDSPSEDRPSRGQGQVCSKPRPRTKDTDVSVLKKNVFKFFFTRSPKKIGLQKKFLGVQQTFNNSKIVLSSSRGQGKFWGLEGSRPRPRTWPSRPRPRTSKCLLEDVLQVFTSGVNDQKTSQTKCYSPTISPNTC